MTQTITCNEKRGRFFYQNELRIMHQNFKELIVMLYQIAQRNGDWDTITALEEIFL